MNQEAQNIEDQVREKIVQSLLALTIPSTWNPDTTLRYIISYISKKDN